MTRFETPNRIRTKSWFRWAGRNESARIWGDIDPVIESLGSGAVVVVDSAWGEGKTSFINMWRGELDQQRIRHVYFDAFKSDYVTDPFLAITKELGDAFPELLKQVSFKRNAMSYGASAR